MAMKVYQSGDIVVVDKTGEPPVLNIVLDRAKYTFVGDSVTVLDYAVLSTQRTDLITSITDSLGTPIGDETAVRKYFESFMLRGDEYAETTDPNEPIDVNVDNLGGQYDAAGALRVANKTVLGTYVQDKGPLTDFLDRISSGTATQTWSNGVVTMSTSGTDYAICQSYKRHLYLAGFSQSPELTFNNFDNQTNVTKRLGYFSSVTTAPYATVFDGFFLEADGTNHKLVIYKFGTLIASINRADWDDPLDGTGVSGYDLDFDLFTIVEFQFLYLGGSGLEMSFNVGGELVHAHTYANSSVNASTFIGSPVQPLRWEIRSNGAAGTLGEICGGVTTGGALDIVGYPRSAATAIGTFINANATATQYLLVAIRANDVSAIGFDISGTSLSTTNDPYTLRLILNPTIAGTPVYNALGNSYFDFALGDTVGVSGTTVTGGTVLETTYVSDRQRAGELQANSLFQPGVDLDGNYYIVALVVEPETTNLDIKGAINFKTL